VLLAYSVGPLGFTRYITEKSHTKNVMYFLTPLVCLRHCSQMLSQLSVNNSHNPVRR